MLPRWRNEGQHAYRQDDLQLLHGRVSAFVRMRGVIEHELLTMVSRKRPRSNPHAGSRDLPLGSLHNRVDWSRFVYG